MTVLSPHDLTERMRVKLRVPADDIEAYLLGKYDGLSGTIVSLSFRKETAIIDLDDGRRLHTVSTVLLVPEQ
jgi:hypothetical protein